MEGLPDEEEEEEGDGSTTREACSRSRSSLRERAKERSTLSERGSLVEAYGFLLKCEKTSKSRKKVRVAFFTCLSTSSRHRYRIGRYIMVLVHLRLSNFKSPS